jgi:hypothetical protein
VTPDRTIYAASCPTCGHECKAWAAYKQATRQEPMRFLGYDGYCPKCMGGFPVENPQLPLLVP